MFPTKKNPSKTTKPINPNFINEPQSSKILKIQRSITNKIMQSFKSRNKLNSQLVSKISAYIFMNPITLGYPLYKQVSTQQLANGQYILYNGTKRNMIKVKIINFWKKMNYNTANIQNTMRFVSHLNQFFDLKQNDNSTMKIITNNANYFQYIFKTINQYNKDGVINEFVIKAFYQIMAKNMVRLYIENHGQYIIIQPSKGSELKSHSIEVIPICCDNENQSQQVNIQFEFVNNVIRIACEEYQLYFLTQQLTKRGKQVLLDPYNYQQIIINDVYIN